MPNFMIVRLQTKNVVFFTDNKEEKARARLQRNAAENQNSTLPMLLQVT